MCIKSSVYSWDIVVTRSGDKLFFDKRDDSNLNLLTVNETAPDPVPEDKDNMNGVQNLSIEATTINQNFSQQVMHHRAWLRLPHQTSTFLSTFLSHAISECFYGMCHCVHDSIYAWHALVHRISN